MAFAAWSVLIWGTDTSSVASEKAAAPSGPSADDNSPPPGIDISKLDEFERKVFFRVINREPSACGKGQSLIYSVKHDSGCRASFYAVGYVGHLVDSGFTDSEISEKLESGFVNRATRRSMFPPHL